MRKIRASFLIIANLSWAVVACTTNDSPPEGYEALGVSEAALDDNCAQCYCDPFFCDSTGGGEGGGDEGGPGTGGDEGGEDAPQDNPYALAFYPNGRSPNPADTCVLLYESADPYWSNNYLCSYANLGLRWSSAGPIAGLNCLQIREPAEPSSTTWRDNYLCGPGSVIGAGTRWSYAGRPLGSFHGCINFNDPQDPHTWADNWLCY
jgi:hypothetical protein